MSDPVICNHLNEGKLVSDAWYYAEFLRSYNTFCVSFRVRDSSGKTGVRYERGLAADSPTPVDRRENRGHAISLVVTEGAQYETMQEKIPAIENKWVIVSRTETFRWNHYRCILRYTIPVIMYQFRSYYFHPEDNSVRVVFH